jgi:xylulokinase
MIKDGLLLGIDIGTSACKAALFAPDGRCEAQANEAYDVYYPRPGWAEQEPEEWWRAVCRALGSLRRGGADLSRVLAVGIDGQSWSAIPVAADGSVLCRTPIWTDTRAAGCCREMSALCGETRLFEKSGNPVQPMYTMPKVLWYKKELPEVYAKTDKILQSNSFIAFRLTGVPTQDPSQGYGWNCYDIKKNEWDTALCRELGVRPGLLPDIAPCQQIIGAVTAQAAGLTGLPRGTPVAAGGLDAACGTLGAGVCSPGETQEQGGQAGGMSICTDALHADRRLILGAHVVPGQWLLQGGTVAGGAALGWFEREFGEKERLEAGKNGGSSFAQLDAEAEKIEPGSDGLVFLPYLAGERSPIWDLNAKGVFYGIDFTKTRAHFARAVMEGVAYALRHNLETAAAAGAEVSVLRAMGGSANSRVWTQIKADVTGKIFEVPSSDTATALGAALLAGVGAGCYADCSDAVRQTVRVRRRHIPDESARAAYDGGYRVYRGLYENLKQQMNARR